MASLGPLSPSSGTNVSFGGTAWASPGNILASDDLRASIVTDQTITSDYLVASNFSGFSDLPPNIHIDGIVVSVERSVRAFGIGIPIDKSIRLFLSGSPIGDDIVTSFFSWTNTTDSIITYGSSTNLWGYALTREIVTNSTFGFGISVTGSDENNKEARVDHIQMTVHYTPLLYPFWNFTS